VKGRIIKVFPGGNTSAGFYSYYPFLLEKGTERVFVLKGGPGTGKSSFIRKIGQKMVDLGCEVEFHYCSSDNDSLDGIAVLEKGIVLVDGTAPHVVDPRYPGGIDEIINLGEYWDSEGLRRYREQIIASTNEVSRLFTRAYGFLRSAKAIAENVSNLYGHCLDNAVVRKTAAYLEEILLQKNRQAGVPEKAIGRERHLFSCAYTPGGYVDFTDSILQDIGTVYYIAGAMGSGKSTLMRQIADKAVQYGWEVEIFHTPLIPDKIGTIVIKELGIALTSSEKFRNSDLSVDLNEFISAKHLAGFQKAIDQDCQLLNQLIDLGIEHIRQAKAEHDILEQYYMQNMDFEGVNEKYEETLSRIFDLAGNKAKTAMKRVYH